MATIGENLRTRLLDILEAGEYTLRVFQAVVPQAGGETPYVWYNRNNEEQLITLDGDVGGLTRTRFDIEVVSDDIDQAIEIANAVRDGLQGGRGLFGTGRILGGFIEDKDDAYIARNESDEGYHIIALDFLVIE